MHCRTAELSDLDAIVDAWHALAEEQRSRHGSRIDPSGSLPAIREYFANQTVDDGVALMEVDTTVVGFVCFSLPEDDLPRAGTAGVLSDLFVDPAHRGEGIGSALLRFAERALRERGADAIELEVLDANREAIEFYRSHGYRTYRRRMVKPIESE